MLLRAALLTRTIALRQLVLYEACTASAPTAQHTVLPCFKSDHKCVVARVRVTLMREGACSSVMGLAAAGAAGAVPAWLAALALAAGVLPNAPPNRPGVDAASAAAADELLPAAHRMSERKMSESVHIKRACGLA